MRLAAAAERERTSGLRPSLTRRASRRASASVRPLPAAPRTSSAPCPWATTAACCSVSPISVRSLSSVIDFRLTHASATSGLTPAGRVKTIANLARVAGPSDDEWIAACRRAVEVQKRVFDEHRGIEARTRYEGVGEGGDNTLVIDRLCEDAIFDELAALHHAGHEFTAVSEEGGSVSFGDGDAPLRVVIDPIDGSLNARRTIPLHSVSIAVAEGDSMGDVTLGYVYEFGAGEEFVATVAGDAALDGRPVHVPQGDGLELVALEATKPERVIKAAEVLRDRAYRIRAPGSIAVALC